jgi:hypothetical protein
MKPPAAVVEPQVVIAVVALRAKRHDAAPLGRRNRGGVCCFVHLCVVPTHQVEILLPVGSTGASVRGRLALPAPATVGSPPRLAAPFFGRDIPDANPNLAQLRLVQRALCVIALGLPDTWFFWRGNRSCVFPS